MIALDILLAWLFADFIAGLVHWFEDRVLVREYKSESLNRIRLDNELHHKHPGAMLQFSLWENISTSAPYSILIGSGLGLMGAHPIIWLGVYFTAFGNIVHRYAHTPEAKKPRIVKVMQGLGLFITNKHHSKHHFDSNGWVRKDESKIRFCPMTNWLNPMLDYINFFAMLERLL